MDQEPTVKKGEDPQSVKNIKEEICNYCLRSKTLIYVHGHYQCKECKTIVIPCCQGDDLLTEEELINVRGGM